MDGCDEKATRTWLRELEWFEIGASVASEVGVLGCTAWAGLRRTSAIGNNWDWRWVALDCRMDGRLNFLGSWPLDSRTMAFLYTKSAWLSSIHTANLTPHV